MTKRMLIMLGCVVLLVALLAGGFALHIKHLMASMPKPSPSVVTAMVVQKANWQPQLNSVGTLIAVHGIDLSSEISGLVRDVKFKSGDDVQAGSVLVQLNADSEVAQLKALQTAVDLAATVLKRNQAQLAVQAISQAQLDTDKADLKNKTALVDQQAATVAKKTIRAPFSGRLGISAINAGQYLNPGDKIVTLQTIDPIHVDFYLPQRQIGQIATGQPVKLTTDSFPNKVFHGTITAINSKVDTASRNVQIEATIANSDRQLLPGMFANVTVDAGSVQSYLTLPQTVITFNPYGSTVFVIQKAKAKKDDKGVMQQPPKDGLEAQQVLITTGETRGDQVAILSGIKEGQQVITSGQIKLKNGAPVVVDNTVQPSNDPNPTPQEH
jgi:membrane fusion protein (multidrug efflux system)